MPEIKEIKFEIQVDKLRYKFPVKTWFDGQHQCFKFDYNRNLIDEIKSLKGARWNPEGKYWYTPAKEQRNMFQLRYLMGLNPYAPYDGELDTSWVPLTRKHIRKGDVPLFRHQPDMAAEMFFRHYKIIAGEMGTSKTLSCIIAIERAAKIMREKHGAVPPIWYAAPRSALSAVEREMHLWSAAFPCELITYESVVKRMKSWDAGKKAPPIVVFDESSKVKNENSQRSQAAQALANGVRDDWGAEGYVIEMSGSPAPKSPADWFSQCEIACPGFIKEGDINKFKRRLGIIVQKESIDGGVYPQLLSWRDDERKCNICGKLAHDPVHHDDLCVTEDSHTFVPSVNEVKLLYERLKGLVSVYFKKDCLDLPDKHYRVVELQPKPSTLRVAKAIVASAPTTIQGLTLLRELSDGFQYTEVHEGESTCSLCKGEKEVEQPLEVSDSCPSCKALVDAQTAGAVIRDSGFDVRSLCGDHQPQIQMVKQSCPTCGGKGEVKKFRRETTEVPCPKDDALSDIIDEHEDVGRLVIFAGFTGSIDRCCKLVQRQGWCVIRMDQGSVKISDHQGRMILEKDFQTMFQDDKENYPKVAFVAHPKSGGMGLTLTASPTIVYFSNTFDAEDRIQSEDRIHRAGMDLNLGATIIDLVHLPSDEKILDNLRKKRDLQSLTLGDFVNALDGERVV